MGQAVSTKAVPSALQVRVKPPLAQVVGSEGLQRGAVPTSQVPLRQVSPVAQGISRMEPSARQMPEMVALTQVSSPGPQMPSSVSATVPVSVSAAAVVSPEPVSFCRQPRPMQPVSSVDLAALLSVQATSGRQQSSSVARR